MKSENIFAYLQVFVTVVVLGIWAFLLISGRNVPAEVYAFVGTVIGFFFRSVAAQAEKQALLGRLNAGK